MVIFHIAMLVYQRVCLTEISVIGWVGYVEWFFGKIDMAHMDLRRKFDMLMFQPLGYHGAATSKDQLSFGPRRLQKKQSKTWRLTRTLWSFLFCSSPLFCFLYLKCLVMFIPKSQCHFDQNDPKWSFTHYPSISIDLHSMLDMPYPSSQWLQVMQRLPRPSLLRLLRLLKAQHQRRMGTLHGWKIVYKWRFQWKIIKWVMFHCHGWLPEGMHDWDVGATFADFNKT